MKKILLLLLIVIFFLNDLVLTQDLNELYECENCNQVINWFKKNGIYDELSHACVGGYHNIVKVCEELLPEADCEEVVDLFLECD